MQVHTTFLLLLSLIAVIPLIISIAFHFIFKSSVKFKEGACHFLQQVLAAVFRDCACANYKFPPVINDAVLVVLMRIVLDEDEDKAADGDLTTVPSGD